MVGRAAGFWSYVRTDDKAVGGRITRLASDISEAYEMLTADPLELFLDRNSIEWGDAWKTRIEEAIAGTTFFIPIITPRYFESEQCRQELVRFTANARQLGLSELLLPVYYVPVPELDADEPNDELMRRVKNTQWEDWRELSLESDDSSLVRKGVRKMATKLADISARVASVPEKVEAPAATPADGSTEEDGPGLLDLLAQGEKAMPRMIEEVEDISAAMDEVTEIMEASSAEVEAADARSAGFADRLRIVRDVARRLDSPAQRIEDHGREYGRALLEADPAVHAILDSAEEAITQGADARSEEIEEAMAFLESMLVLAKNADEGMEGLRQFVKALEESSTMSRDIRRPATQMKRGLQGMFDGHALIQAWAERARALEALIPESEEPGPGAAPPSA